MQNFKALFISSLLSTTVLFSNITSPHAETWEIEGFETPRVLGEAEAAFNKVRRAENKIGDIPQKAIDTVAAIEEELFALNKEISDSISAYEIRQEAMEDEIANDENLMDIETQRVAGERQRLNARRDQILSAMDRIKDNNPTLEQLEILRTEFGNELTQIEGKLATLREEETNVRNALNRRQTQRELELDELEAAIPNVTERMAIEERLRHAQRIGFEAEEELSKLREQEHTAATAFLQELLANSPEYLVRVKASFKGDVFYNGNWVPDGEAQASSQAEQDAINAVLEKEEDNLAKLENSTQVWRGKVRQLGQDIKQYSDTATQMLNLIAQEQRRTLWINMGLEMGGTVAASLATGGMAAILKFIKETDTFVEGLGKVRKSFADLPLEKNKLIMDSVTAGLSKIINSEAVDALTVADNIYGVGLRFDVNKNTGLRSDAALLVAGDLTEMALSTGINGVADATKSYFTGVAKAATPTTNILRGAGVELATTGLKAIVIARAQSLNNQRADEYLKAHVSAEVYHGTFLEAKRIWLRLDAVSKAQKELVEGLRARAKNGPKPLKLDADSNSAAATKGDEIEIEFEFSKPMIAAPIISAEGLLFGDAEESDVSKRRWKVTATLENDLTEVTLDIGLNKRERPWFLLDNNPKTPPRLASLIKDHWDGYEAGRDTNHVLNFGLTPITFCGGVNYKTEPEKLQSLLGKAFAPLKQHIDVQIAELGTSDGKKIMNENLDVEAFGISKEQFDATFENTYALYANVVAGGMIINGSKIFTPTTGGFSLGEYCSVIRNISNQCMSQSTKALIQAC